MGLLTWIKLGAVIAIVLFAIGYYKHVEGLGYDKRRAEDEPALTACSESLEARTAKDCADAILKMVADSAQLKLNVDGLEKTIREQNLSLQPLADAQAKAKALADAAAKEADSNALFYAERLKSLRSRIDHPSQDPNADTDRTLRDYARDRWMR